MTKHVLIVSLRLRLTFDTHRYASQTSRRPDVSGMRLVCSTDIAISDGTFGGFVLALSYSLYLYASLDVFLISIKQDKRHGFYSSANKT